jgi:hypothetical protein
LALTVEDRLDLHELIARLSQALDFSQPDDLVALFVADGVYQAVSSVASGEQVRFRHEGSDALRGFGEAMAQHRGGLARHWTGNIVLMETGPGAQAVSYVLFVVIDPETKERRVTISGVHRDEFVRTESGWRFASRTVVADI